VHTSQPWGLLHSKDKRRLQFIFVKGWCKWLPIGKKSALLEEIKFAWDECVTMIYVHIGIGKDWQERTQSTLFLERI
jgi:hypothetical protein